LPKSPLVRRYTDLPSLIYLLRTRALTLLNPQFWPDRNDAHYVEVYGHRVNAGSILALCFTDQTERSHHWQVFAGGPAGVCIEFDKEHLKAHLLVQEPSLRMESIAYKKVRELKSETLGTMDLPFTKRWPFQDEKEVRIVYCTDEPGCTTKDIGVPLEVIRGVILSPLVPQSQSEQIKAVLRGIDGCANLQIHRSSLIDNAQWKKGADGAP
jgi:hypothetical protein